MEWNGIEWNRVEWNGVNGGVLINNKVDRWIGGDDE